MPVSLPRHLARIARATGLGALVALLGLTAPALAATGFDHGILWKLDAGNGTPPSYLFGTIHVADPRVLDVPPAVTDALDACNTAVFEVLLDNGMQTQMAKKMLLDGGRTLKDVIGPKLFAKVTEVGRSYGLIPSVAELYKPWALVLMFSIPPEDVRLLAQGKPALDAWLQQRARSEGKKLVGLETIDEQIAVMNGLSESDQVALLTAVVEHKAEIDDQFHRLVELYLARDLAGIAAVNAEPLKGSDTAKKVFERFNDRLLKNRNARMLKRLAPLLARGGVFVAVGAMHLVGSDGLLSGLAAQGYKVTAVY